MVTNAFQALQEGRGRLRTMTGLVAVYVVIVIGTVLALAALSAVEPRLAPSAAWIHAVIVMAFAVVLPLRLRALRRGGRRALRAVGLIAAALFLVNVVEATIPHLFPVWMRVEMVVIAVIMACVILIVIWEAVASGRAQARS